MAYKSIDILYLSSWYPNKYQPFVGNFVRRQAVLLAKTNNVTVIHTVAHQEESGLNIEKVVNGNLTEYFVYHQRGKTIAAKRKMQRAALNLAMEKLDRVELIMTQILLPKGLQFIDAVKNFDCPWIHIEQGSYFRPEVRNKWSIIQKVIIRRTTRHIDQVLAVSDFLKKDMIPVFPKKEIKLISNHVDAEHFFVKPKTSNGTTQFLHVSTLDEATKNPLGIFEACKILKDSGETNFSLLVISDEPTDKWEKYCKENGISDVVSFEGPKEWEDLPSFYQKADAFILNSIYETFSIVLAESWSTGTPVISTPVGIAYDLPKSLGIQTKINNPESVAAAMEDFIKNKQSYQTDIIHEAAEHFTESSVNESLHKIIVQHVK
ncbi:MAG: glycosyltransferase involved in cell wall biosynthesis [Flavobacteriaceae bacterium]|jgi:glycosyltransferase involved in cell wall biosynthesis